MEDKIREGRLYDFYGPLLNDHKKRIYEEYVLDDLSLSEIAENEGISRQGVHDLIRRCTKKMEDLEEKLLLIHKFDSVRSAVGDILKEAGEIEPDTGAIEKACGRILEVL